MNSRSPHTFYEDIKSLQVVLPGWSWNLTEINASADLSYKVTLENAAGTAIIGTFLFGGSATGTCTAGANLVSDPLIITIPRGTTLFARIYMTSAGGMVHHSYPSDTGNGQRMEYSATTLTDRTGTPGVFTNTDVGNTIAFTPLAFIATTTRESLFLIGDSKCLGLQDTYDSTGFTGELARAIGGHFAFIQSGNTGDSVTGASGFNLNHAKRAPLAQYCSAVLSEYGVNDVSNGTSLATFQAGYATFWGTAEFAGKSIYHTTLTTEVTGTYLTDAGQTPKVGFTAGAACDQINAWLRTVPSPLRAVFDVRAVTQSPTNNNVWNNPGATPALAGAVTSDGIHESQLGYRLAPSAFTLGLFRTAP